MPQYEYKCLNCCSIYNTIQSSLESAPKFMKCNNCGEQAQRIEISQSSFQLVGNGWPGKTIKEKSNE